MPEASRRQLVLHHLEAASSYAEEIGNARLQAAIDQLVQSLKPIAPKQDSAPEQE